MSRRAILNNLISEGPNVGKITNYEAHDLF